MRSLLCIYVAVALSACAQPALQEGSAPALQADNRPATVQEQQDVGSEFGELKRLFAEFKTICAANVADFSVARSVAERRGFKSVLIPEAMESADLAFNAFIFSDVAKNQHMCQIADRTNFGKAEDQMLRQYLSAEYPAFDPKRKKQTQKGSSYLIDIAGETFAFYAASNPKTQSTAIGVNRTK